MVVTNLLNNTSEQNIFHDSPYDSNRRFGIGITPSAAVIINK